MREPVTMNDRTEIPEIHAARLRLRAFRASDAADVRRLAGAFEVADTTQTVPHPYPEGAAEQWIAGLAPAWADGTGIAWAITEKAGSALVGAIGLRLTPEHAMAELGYWIGVPHWRRGYATEAGAAVLAFGFARLGLNRIQARHLVRNPASGRVMVKLGMRHEGRLRQATRKYDRFEDLELYARLAGDPKPG
jgi:ribosomal-protein-alanine N-acetyltransferase